MSYQNAICLSSFASGRLPSEGDLIAKRWRSRAVESQPDAGTARSRAAASAASFCEDLRRC